MPRHFTYQWLISEASGMARVNEFYLPPHMHYKWNESYLALLPATKHHCTLAGTHWTETYQWTKQPADCITDWLHRYKANSPQNIIKHCDIGTHRKLILVHLTLCVYVFWVSLYCNMDQWTWWDWSLILRTTTSLSALTLFVSLFDP